MPNARRDDNYVPAMMGVSSVDGVTPIPLTIDAITGRLRVTPVGTTGGNLDPAVLQPVRRDDNRVKDMLGESSTDRTPIPLTVGFNNGLRITPL